MTDRTANRLASALWVVALATCAISFGLLVASLRAGAGRPADAWGPRGATIPLSVTFATMGALIARGQRHNAVGWLFLAAGVLAGLASAAEEWGTYVLRGGNADLPGGALGAATSEWLWIPNVACILVFPVLVFPDGRFPTRPARWIAYLAVPIVVFVTLLQMFHEGLIEGYNVENPLALVPLTFEETSSFIGLFMLPIIAAQVVLIRRLRRSTGAEREQLRWIVSAEAVTALMLLGNAAVLWDGTPSWWITGIETAAIAAMLSIPVAGAVAILKYRLYDIDVVISRAVLLAGLTAFVTLVYAAIVGGVGALVQRTDEPNHALAIAASVVVALAFQPVRERLHRFADRVAYGERAAPYEVLAELAERMRASEDPETVLAQLARSLTDGTGAVSTTIWLRVHGELRPAAQWPRHLELPNPVAVDDGIDALGGDRSEPVVHGGDLLGAITLTKRYADPLPPAEDRLVRDLAGHAGLVLRNLRLTTELQQRVEELRESRQRLVNAQDAERRRIERDLHDGAQQQLVALKVHLSLASHTAADEGAPRTADTLTQLSGELGEAIETLRELAHGIYPPRLAADGLAGALAARVTRSAVPVEVDVDETVGRLDQEVEAAVYFCCLEALQNVAKYAGGTSARVELRRRDGDVCFAIVDDGVGFDPEHAPAGAGLANMRDRVEALGGELAITASPGGGTRVEGRVPVDA
ncbi:MAG TPA: histidine kinase [Acidimicrobiales bacterium]